MLRGLYAITDPILMPGNRLLEKAEAALAGGCRLLQYRDKSTDQQRRVREASALRELCDARGALLIINDSPALAQKVAAPGLHLGQQDEALEAARQQLGPGVIIGATCHDSLDLAAAAAAAGADYLAFGRFFPSRTKPDAPPAALELLDQAKRQFDLPLVAIGGINRDNAPALLAAGADCLAVCHDLFRWDEPAQIRAQTAAYCALFEATRPDPLPR